MEEKKEYPSTPDSYQLISVIGQGSSAVVHKALCKPFNEFVAIKIIELEKIANSIEESLVLFILFFNLHLIIKSLIFSP
jgi:serine/threonine protein kinase